MIEDAVKKILAEVPKDVMVVAAIKTRTSEEVLRAIDAGIRYVGENYVKEAQELHPVIGNKAMWHMIGTAQSNKAKIIAQLFDMVESVDSYHFAKALDTQCGKIGKKIPILLEINSAREEQKSGILPEDALEVIKSVSALPNLSVQGLMTMGPLLDDPEEIRPYFKLTKELFEDIKKQTVPNVEMKYLSMGMTSTYRVGIEEGANIVRVGTLLFGERHYH
ncbi:MAG: YggS family pyridoxal phosphate-dependent enzyme [Dehalococcoidales bacterium]|nr:YggS family pyridoxal phosphate-dependent enzyme [Dehalococcoidales bacterium]